MPPRKSARKTAGRGRPPKQQQSTTLQQPQRHSSPSSSDHNTDDGGRSPAGSDVSLSTVASDVPPSVSSQAATAKEIKRAKKTPYHLDIDEEKLMLEFLQENPMLWDIKLTDYRMTDKKNKLWDDQGEKLGKTADHLKRWFKSLRDIYTRLDKKKSGDGAPDLTEREQWIKDNFSFMKAATRHRPDPVNSVSKCI